MASLVKDLIEAGIHFGQRRSSWNPKMSPYIFGTRNKIHIIDIRETIKGLLLAKRFIQRTVADYYKIKVTEMYSKKRSRTIVRPRQLAMALTKELTPLSLPDIGEAFGGRDQFLRIVRLGFGQDGGGDRRGDLPGRLPDPTRPRQRGRADPQDRRRLGASTSA